MAEHNAPIDVDEAVKAALREVEAAATLDDLRTAEAGAVGKRGALAAAKKALGGLDPGERRAAGERINAAMATVSDAVEAKRAELSSIERAKQLEADRLDLTEIAPPRLRGRAHIVTQTRQRLEDVFVGMGYTVEEGPEVETDWHNFQALNIPPAHPARNNQDTLYFDYGPPESTLLRTHTSPVQIRTMLDKPPPIYAIMPGRVYRKDTPDARHTPAFSQIEGLVVDKGISFGHLAGTIATFTEAYFGEGIKSRLRPGYFPFTEPSAEFEVGCPICRGAGCRTCSSTGWIELGGCGMVHPNVFVAVGLDPEEWSGFAFGFGIDRCAQVFHAIPDMRVMADNDLRFIQQF
ncbi:MAG TPA: phenylalanine--tRNA ligase subunit alpha [Acidimicrobiales bacterium]|nr:phenylalanine--tRNA ligase subunit alpha [Acidimicrobiales bacterium]